MSIQLLTLLRTAELPTTLTDLDRLLLMIHADAHIDKLGKAILPIRDLKRLTGCHDKSIIRSRGRLVQRGALIRVTKGYEDQASEYAVSENFLRSHQVTDGLPVSRNKKKTGYQEVASEIPRSNATDTDKLPDGYPILKDLHTDKRKDNELVFNSEVKAKSAPREINVERWRVVTGEISRDDLRCIEPNSYSEQLLDQAITNGYSPSYLRKHFGRMKWGNAYDIGGLFISELRKFAGVSPPPKENALPPWCEGEGCDPIERTWLEPSERSDGTMTHNCPNCHPFEVRRSAKDEPTSEVPSVIQGFAHNFRIPD